MYEQSVRKPADTARRERIEWARAQFDPVLVDRVAQGLFETDPLADAVVEAFAAMPGRSGWELLDQALVAGIDSVPGAPQVLRELLEPLENPPDWVDWEQVDAGNTAWWRFMLVSGMAMMSALVYGYAFADLVKPLAMHGRLEEMAPRRVEETGSWLSKVGAPGALRPGEEGFRETVKVRLMHATIRHHLRRSPRWDREAWGEPIHATAGAATAMSFAISPVYALADAGVRLTAVEREAMVHQWRWIGTLMGVPDELLPGSAARAEEFLKICAVVFAPPDEDSRRLTQAVVFNAVRAERVLPAFVGDRVRPLLRRHVSQFLTAGTRRRVDAQIADALGIPNNLFQYALPAMRPLLRAREVLRRAGLLGSDERIAARQRALFDRLLARMDAADRPIYAEDVAVKNLRGQ